MSRRKCFFSCEGKVTLFSFPKEENTRQQWIQFFPSGLEQSYSNVFICSRHFTDDCFHNLPQYEAGFSARLSLKDGAVPTVCGRLRESGPQYTTANIRAQYRDMACQTQLVSTSSVATQSCSLMISVGTQCTYVPSIVHVGTQLSRGTLKEHTRSKGTQYEVLCKSGGSETGPQLSLTPAKTLSSFLGLRPAKRARLELLDEWEEEPDPEDNEENTFQIPQPHDSTYEPGDSMTEPSEISEMDTTTNYSDTKYIVFESCLKELFKTCPQCRCVCDTVCQKMGTFVSFSQLCHNCHYSRKWESQPINASTPVGNLQMSAAIYFTGGSFFQVEKIFKAMKIHMLHYDTFKRHARMFLEPAIVHQWSQCQETLIQQLQQEEKIAISGDTQAVSSGHSAKFKNYTIMHLESNKIIDIQLIQSSEVGGSANMEKEGLRRGLDFLVARNVKVDYIVTDRHKQVQKFLRERQVTQYYDVRHLEKGLSKKLSNLAKKKDCMVVGKWLPSIKNHIYWTATSSTSGPEKVAKWRSLINHIQDVHTHDDPIFPKCAHPDRVSRDRSKWFQPGSEALNKVKKVLMSKRVLHVVEKLSHDHQTSLESFNSVILCFAPKNVLFPFIGLLCRLYLAAMYFNENTRREQATALQDVTVHKMGPCRRKPVKTEPTFNYIGDLMRLVFEHVFLNPTLYTEELKQIPVPKEQSAQHNRPSKVEVTARHTSRLSQRLEESWSSSQPDQETPGISRICRDEHIMG